MAGLQKFNDLLKELQDETTALFKKRDELAAECHTLEAKKAFTNDSILELKQQLQVVKDQRAEALVEKQRMIDTLSKEYDRLKADMTILENKQLRMQSTLDTMKEAADQAVIEHDSVLREKGNRIAAAETELHIKQDQIDDTDKLIAAKQGILSDLQTITDQKQSELDSLVVETKTAVRNEQVILQSIRADIVRVQDEFADVYDKLQSKQQEYAEADKKHSDYLEYEQRANKALEAREQSLLEKEASLEAQSVRIQRRGGILDKI